jgi:RelE toxin of RelE / RelB toxin-antitoxin system
MYRAHLPHDGRMAHVVRVRSPGQYRLFLAAECFGLRMGGELGLASDQDFARLARKQSISDDDLREAVDRAERGLIDADPGRRRLVERFEWHYTPKHGSWLNMAESACYPVQ